MIRVRFKIPRRSDAAGFLSVEMNVLDEEEATTIAKAIAYIYECDVGMDTDTGLFCQVKGHDLIGRTKPRAVDLEKPPWED